jgi:fumarate reductase subunit C
MSRRPHLRKLPKSWWLKQGRYTHYMVRELTCVFIAAYTVLVLIGLYRLSEGPAAYDAFLAALRSPLGIAFHAAALVFALIHTATWFGLAPKAMPLRLGAQAVPAGAIVMAHYAVWIVASAGLFLWAGI